MSSIAEELPIAILVTLLAVAVFTDIRYGRIQNKITFPCMAAGLALGLINHGLQGLLLSLAGMGLVLGLYLLVPSKSFGGGDIKLMMAVGSLIGFKLAVWAMLFSAVVGGILALIVMARYRTVLSTTKNLATNLYLSVALRAPVELSNGSAATRFRYSPAIALGTLVALLVK